MPPFHIIKHASLPFISFAFMCLYPHELECRPPCIPSSSLELGMMILTIRLQTTRCLQLLVHIAIYTQKAFLKGFEGVTDHTSTRPSVCNVIHFNLCNIWFNQLGMGQVFRSRNLVFATQMPTVLQAAPLVVDPTALA